MRTKINNRPKGQKTKTMNHNKFDNEYYVMSVDGANNHPMLAWGQTKFSPFLKATPVDETILELPLKIIFDQPYPTHYEMADLLMLASVFAGSEKLKQLFEKLKLYGVQFVPVEIGSNKGDIISGHYVLHIWNKLSAINKSNYDGKEPDMFGTIHGLKRFSLDEKLLDSIPAEKRLLFGLRENSTMYVIHETVCQAIQSECLTGIRFWKVSEWDDNAMFR